MSKIVEKNLHLIKVQESFYPSEVLNNTILLKFNLLNRKEQGPQRHGSLQSRPEPIFRTGTSSNFAGLLGPQLGLQHASNLHRSSTGLPRSRARPRLPRTRAHVPPCSRPDLHLGPVSSCPALQAGFRLDSNSVFDTSAFPDCRILVGLCFLE